MTSPPRKELSKRCIYQPACPGCPRFSIDAVDPEALRLLRSVGLSFGLDSLEQQVTSGSNYRHRVRLSVRGSRGNVEIGIFEAGSHRLVDIVDCPVHHRAIRVFLRQLKAVVNASQVEPYDEKNHLGLLRAVQIAVEPGSERLQVVFLVRDKLEKGHQIKRKMKSVFEAFVHSETIHSIWLSAQEKRTNSLVGDHLEKICGKDFLEDHSTSACVFYHPTAFGQANPILHQQVTRRIASWVPLQYPVTEYYCGVGTIGLGLAQRGQEITFNELGPGSLASLDQGLIALDRDSSKTVVLRGKAGEYASSYDKEGIVIVDPPRKGLDPLLLTRLIAEPPRRLIYLSCGIQSFVAECEHLRRAGKTELVHLSAWGYFPYTKHVETLAVFDRNNAHLSTPS